MGVPAKGRTGRLSVAVEGFGLPVVEAMEAGAVIVAGYAPNFAELPLDDALMFDPTNYLDFSAAPASALSASAERRAEIGARKQERCGCFRWSTFCAELEGFAAAARGVTEA